MNTPETKASVREAVAEAIASHLSLKRINEATGISVSTLRRWSRGSSADSRKGAKRRVQHKLTATERNEILRVVNLPEYRDLNPAEIVAILAEKGHYIGSERTIYRVLKENRMLAHRGLGRGRTPRNKPSHKATGTDQLLSWDITYMHTNIKGIYLYLYMVIDVWSRKIVGWEIHTEETSKLSARMIDRLSREMDLSKAVLHADNGGPMKGSTMLLKLYELGVTASFSRPRVSEDNPYSEALFKTLKYRPGYPRRFTSLESARNWVANFVHWYNHEHRHSGINYVTPEQRHTGQDRAILKKRAQTFAAAKKRNPSRWSQGSKKWKYQKAVTLGEAKAS